MKTVRELRGTKHVPYTPCIMYICVQTQMDEHTLQTGVKPHALPFSLWDIKYQIFDIIILIKTN